MGLLELEQEAGTTSLLSSPQVYLVPFLCLIIIWQNICPRECAHTVNTILKVIFCLHISLVMIIFRQLEVRPQAQEERRRPQETNISSYSSHILLIIIYHTSHLPNSFIFSHYTLLINIFIIYSSQSKSSFTLSDQMLILVWRDISLLQGAPTQQRRQTQTQTLEEEW